MFHLEYGIAAMARGQATASRGDKPRHVDACRDVARGQINGEKAGYEAGRYAAITWFIIAAGSLIAWLVIAFVARMGFGISGFDSIGVQIVIKALAGVIVGSMVLVGVIVAKSPGRYVVNGRRSFTARRFGPSPIDFWIGAAVGVVAALAL